MSSVFFIFRVFEVDRSRTLVRTEPPQPIPTPSPSDFKSKHKFVFIILKVTLHSHRMCQAMDRGISSIQT